MATSYRIYLNHVMQGPYNLDELLTLKDLSKETLVCEVGDIEWESMGSCRSIQQQLAYQPQKWGPLRQILQSTSPTPPVDRWGAGAVSNSGDFVQRPSSRERTQKAAASRTAPAKKAGIFSWISNWTSKA